MLNKICVYGTLRRWQINWQSIVGKFGISNFQWRRTMVIPGYKLYDLIYYPAAIESSTIKDKITVELFCCNDQVYDYIASMEKNAGYYEDIISIDDKFYSIFLMTSVGKTDIEIENGDWVTYIKTLHLQ